MSTLLAGAIAVGVAVLGILWRMMSVAKKSGVDAQKAKEAEARDQNIKRLKDAIDVGNRVQPNDPGVPIDPYDRSRRGK